MMYRSMSYACDSFIKSDSHSISSLLYLSFKLTPFFFHLLWLECHAWKWNIPEILVSDELCNTFSWANAYWERTTTTSKALSTMLSFRKVSILVWDNHNCDYWTFLNFYCWILWPNLCKQIQICACRYENLENVNITYQQINMSM